MPGKVKVKIISGRNLPVMDRSSDTTDAYVEIKLGNTTYKTDVCRKSLNPQWNSEWYRFEVDDSELQDEPLQIRLMDHDTYSANDAIGKVYLDLNPLLLPAASLLLKWNKETSNNQESPSNSVMSGWIPVYDTMHGIRGEVNVVVKVELFSDFNKFRQSSCGIQFFCSPSVPHGYYAQVVHGFVEELVVNDDPEYQWIDKIRTPRASNEARQTLFFKLSGELQRKIGVKTLDLGGNAVVGYMQAFDLEGESGIVARGIGTAVTLIKMIDIPTGINPETGAVEEKPEIPPTEIRTDIGHHRTESMGTPKMAHSPIKLNSLPCIHRRSSDSDLSITPKGSSLTGSDRSGAGQYMRNAVLRSTVPPENFEIMEYPFLTMSKYPDGFISFIGGTVSARSVKLLERISNIDEPESRDTWWSEIRMEIRSHARALNCNSVLGYTETTSICEDVCVLSAGGTAAIIGCPLSSETSNVLSGLPIVTKHNNKEPFASTVERSEAEKIPKSENNKSENNSPERDILPKQACSICHLPYMSSSMLRNSTSKCMLCRSGKVPDVMIATIEVPDGIPTAGRGCFVQSYVCRPLRDVKGESYAKEVSDGLPFLEYELHRLLINKLKVKAMNAVFGLKVRISIGERMLVGIATGTAVFLSPLPTPPMPKLKADKNADENKIAQLQKSLHDTVKRNREIYQVINIIEPNGKTQSDTDDSEDEQGSLDLSVGNKDCCILEVDDPEDVDVLNSIMEPRPPDGFHVVNTENVPGLEDLEIVKNLQMFTQIWRAKIQPPFTLDKHFHRLLQSVYFKLRRMIPCALCDLQFRVDSPEPEEIQLCVLGMALGLGDVSKISKAKRKPLTKKLNVSDDDLIFNMEDDQIPENSVAQTPPSTNYLLTQSLKHRQKSPIRNRFVTRQRHLPYKERHGVDISPLSYIPGGKIEKYLGNLNFFFIRETTSIREEGGLSGFIHGFMTEILAIVRAHVTALGGNAMVAYFLTECVLNHNLHKNQGQCLINVGGDVVYVSYYSDDQ